MLNRKNWTILRGDLGISRDKEKARVVIEKGDEWERRKDVEAGERHRENWAPKPDHSRGT